MSGKERGFRRRIGWERIMLMLPFNVVLAARVRGEVSPSGIAQALERLRLRHPLLAVRVKMEADDTAWLLTDSVPEIEIHVERRQGGEQWLERIKKEFRTPFPLETGPLVRCALVHSAAGCEIILCGHHIICDGMSLGYLVRDMLPLLAGKTQGPDGPLIPPPIDRSTVPSPPATNWPMRFVLDRINRRWAAKSIRFSEQDRRHLHERFWERNGEMQVLAWQMGSAATGALVDRCHAENVMAV